MKIQLDIIHKESAHTVKLDLGEEGNTANVIKYIDDMMTGEQADDSTFHGLGVDREHIIISADFLRGAMIAVRILEEDKNNDEKP